MLSLVLFVTCPLYSLYPCPMYTQRTKISNIPKVLNAFRFIRIYYLKGAILIIQILTIHNYITNFVAIEYAYYELPGN